MNTLKPGNSVNNPVNKFYSSEILIDIGNYNKESKDILRKINFPSFSNTDDFANMKMNSSLSQIQQSLKMGMLKIFSETSIFNSNMRSPMKNFETGLKQRKGDTITPRSVSSSSRKNSKIMTEIPNPGNIKTKEFLDKIAQSPKAFENSAERKNKEQNRITLNKSCTRLNQSSLSKYMKNNSFNKDPKIIAKNCLIKGKSITNIMKINTETNESQGKGSIVEKKYFDSNYAADLIHRNLEGKKQTSKSIINTQKFLEKNQKDNFKRNKSITNQKGLFESQAKKTNQITKINVEQKENLGGTLQNKPTIMDSNMKKSPNKLSSMNQRNIKMIQISSNITNSFRSNTTPQNFKKDQRKQLIKTRDISLKKQITQKSLGTLEKSRTNKSTIKVFK